jgi:hypothetical protein
MAGTAGAYQNGNHGVSRYSKQERTGAEMKDPKTGLTWKTADAVDRYLLENVAKDNVNYTFPQALRDAGYSARYVHSFASKIWENIGVQNKINSFKSKAAMKAELTIAQVLDDLDYGVNRAKERGDLMALARFSELRGKYLAMFTDRSITDAEQVKIAQIDETTRKQAQIIATMVLTQGMI